jgi:hypothetical protein
VWKDCFIALLFAGHLLVTSLLPVKTPVCYLLVTQILSVWHLLGSVNGCANARKYGAAYVVLIFPAG